ncbi:XRE family transcriptional regulator [Mesorhizobium sp. NZP2298]|nr:XRE family transcriptional regulator [Mesorhizobium sp. NZP2298]
MTQEQLAEIYGLSQQYISGLEKGKGTPTIVTLYELAPPCQPHRFGD